jgi:hypothetical protein
MISSATTPRQQPESSQPARIKKFKTAEVEITGRVITATITLRRIYRDACRAQGPRRPGRADKNTPKMRDGDIIRRFTADVSVFAHIGNIEILAGFSYFAI